MSDYQNATDAAAEVRAALKKAGFSSKQVSVRAEYFSLGSAINVRIKDGQVPLPLVKDIAEGKERISRCEITGEILGGGNRYVNLSISPEAKALKARRFIEAVEKAAYVLGDASDGTLQPIVPGYYIGKGLHNSGFSLWGEHGHIQNCWALKDVAYALAIEKEKAA